MLTVASHSPLNISETNR